MQQTSICVVALALSANPMAPHSRVTHAAGARTATAREEMIDERRGASRRPPLAKVVEH
jgi:hypothetical protein